MSAYTENSDGKSGAKENWEQGYAKCWEKQKKTKAKAAAPVCRAVRRHGAQPGVFAEQSDGVVRDQERPCGRLLLQRG